MEAGRERRAWQKLLDVASNAKGGESAKLVEVMKTPGEEKAREHELAMRERAMKVTEENAKLGWRKLELQQARSAILKPSRLRSYHGIGVRGERPILSGHEALGSVAVNTTTGGVM